MKRQSAFYMAFRSAFARSAHRSVRTSAGADVTTRLSGPALAVVVGFPGAIGGMALAAAMMRTGVADGAFSFGAGLWVIAGCLLVLGLRSFATVTSEGLRVRFFGLRSSAVRFDQLRSATFEMTVPSLSFGIALRDRDGRKVILHANWWRSEADVTRRVMHALVDHDVAMDRTTARLTSKLLRIARPKARIVHHGFIRHDRTW